MIVLVVDDQPAVLEGLRLGIHWQEIGVEQVLLASNAREARKILFKFSVDIMLCDIEMPDENGLQLFQWVKEQQIGCRCLFLTSHAEFTYAQQAIGLSCCDYIVQPARYEDIQRSLQQELAKISLSREQKRYSAYGEENCLKKSVLMGSIFQELLTGDQFSMRQVLENLNRLDICIKPDSSVYLFLVQVLENEIPGSWLTGHAMENFLRKTTEKLFSIYGQKILMAQLNSGELIFLCYTEENAKMDIAALKRQLTLLIDACKFELNRKIACYAGPSVTPRDLSGQAKGLFEMKQLNVSLQSRIFFIQEEEEIQQSMPADNARMSQWKKMMFERSYDSVREEMISYLEEEKKQGRVNHQMLLYFYKEFFQTLLHVSKHYELSLMDIFGGVDNVGGITAAFRSVDAMKEMIFHTIGHLKERSVNRSELDHQIDKILTYIHDNIEKDIRRSDISQRFFLNQDYLSRLFKQETGVSLKEYIIIEKMKTAQILLKTTSLPVGIVAAKVGFSHFSHFSQTYKRIIGSSPEIDRK
jgi:two-component system response regulator YesN